MVKQIQRHAKVVAVGALSAGMAAGAGAIATAGATTTHSHSNMRPPARAGMPHPGPRGALPPGVRPAVHGQIVVPTKTGFATVTFDRGTIKSVSGQQLVVTEGTPKRTYQTVTLTIPSSAVVRLDGKSASLDSLPIGDHVMVVQGPNKTRVLAHDRGMGPGRPGAQGGPAGSPGQGAPLG